MSLLSKLFGKSDASAKGTEPDPEVRKIFEKIEHLFKIFLFKVYIEFF